MPKTIRCYDYVNQPYSVVCEALRLHSNAVFRDATQSAESRAHGVASELRVNLAGFDIGKDIAINIKSYLEVEQSLAGKKFTVNLEWKAVDRPGLFPVMQANLDAYPITSTETQLDFQGQYEPPLGVLGRAIDAVVGHRIAEATVHQFLTEVAAYLRNHIPTSTSDSR